MSTIQGLLKNFTMDYLRQTNLLLGEGVSVENESELASLDTALSLLQQPVPGVVPAIEEKKERKKRTHDPNAPKRPLTPYFLYMQTARPIIASDLGPDAAKGAVQEEGQRRWSTMSSHDKLVRDVARPPPPENADALLQGWDQAYQYNLRLYNARVHSYKAGNANAKLMSDDEALKYAEEYNVRMPVGKDAEAAGDQDAIAEQLGQLIPDEDDTTAKTPKSVKKEGRKRKTATPAVEAEAIPISAAASPDKKRKRTSKVTEDKEPEAKKPGRKKAKSG